AILLGGGIGILFKGRIPEKISENIIRALGLCICVIGVSGALEGDIMLMAASMALGAFSGELLDIDGGLNRLGAWMQSKFARGDKHSSFTQGFVGSTLLFCVGAMAIVGSIDSGLADDQSVIFTKSIIDGSCAMFFASSLGIGVLFSAIPVLLYQGSIEFFAGFLQNVLTSALVTQISAVGSLMILGIGLNMTVGAKIKVANLLPGFVFAVVYFYLFLSL
ncbi:MAG: DUF554 domain-containing protein, partial [Oscillospiraceae bacterium]|nr:DUF554 domain-containing protein [Oscillospiraceae bacterium]